MKALTRDKGETVKETDGVDGIDWTNGYPLVAPEWAGGPYTLVEDYVGPEPEDMDGDGHAPVRAITEEPAEDAIIVNGRAITKAELMRLLE